MKNKTNKIKKTCLLLVSNHHLILFSYLRAIDIKLLLGFRLKPLTSLWEVTAYDIFVTDLHVFDYNHSRQSVCNGIYRSWQLRTNSSASRDQVTVFNYNSLE